MLGIGPSAGQQPPPEGISPSGIAPMSQQSASGPRASNGRCIQTQPQTSAKPATATASRAKRSRDMEDSFVDPELRGKRIGRLCDSEHAMAGDRKRLPTPFSRDDFPRFNHARGTGDGQARQAQENSPREGPRGLEKPVASLPAARRKTRFQPARFAAALAVVRIWLRRYSRAISSCLSLKSVFFSLGLMSRRGIISASC
jgi:hypothetical protein